MPFPPMPGSTDDLKEAARARIQRAVETFELGTAPAAGDEELRPEALDATSLLLSGKYDEVIAAYRQSSNPSPELRNAAAWAHVERGNSLDNAAKSAARPAADKLWQSAIAAYEEATRIKPDMHEALYNGGIALDDWAKTKSGEEADRLWEQACERYAEVVRIKPDMHEAFYNWGIALADWARTKSGKEADRLWKEACERYAEAVRINPDMHRALNNLGNALVNRFALASDAELRESLLQEAEDKCRRAEEIKPGAASYNMACVYGRREDAENCRHWLTRAKEYGDLPASSQVLADPDLSAFHDEPWFREIVGA